MDDLWLALESPLRPVDARSRMAGALARAARFPTAGRYDRATCELAAYLNSCRGVGGGDHWPGQPGRIPARFTDLHQAYSLRLAAPPPLPAAVEAMLLTELSGDNIAQRVGVTPASIAWYAAAFFDVRDRLRCAHFILNYVIEASRQRSGGDWCQYGWKLIAYLGGDAAFQEALGASQVTSLEAWVSRLRGETRVVLHEKARRVAAGLSVADAARLTTLLAAGEATAPPVDAQAPNQFEMNIQGLMAEIPWTVGTHIQTTTRVTPFESGAAELRADEMLELELGGNLPNAEQILAATFPPPSKPKEDLSRPEPAR